MIKKNKNITFFISSLAGGGAEKVCVNLANGLSQLGWNVTLLVLNNHNAVYEDKLNNDIKYVVLNVNHIRHSILPVYRYFKASNVKKVIAFNYDVSLVLILIRKMFFIKFSLISRNVNSLSNKVKDTSSSLRAKLLSRLTIRLYSQVDHVVNQCKAMEDDLLRVLPKLNKKTSVIYNPVSKEFEQFAINVAENEHINGDYLLCVGRLEKQKAFHRIIQGFALISGEYPELILKIVGEGSLLPQLMCEAESLGLADRICFESFNDNIIPYYCNARATVLTSLYEGFPNVLIESITLGTPVVAYDCVSGPSEIVIPGVNGELVKSNSVEGLVIGLRKVLDNKEKYNEVNIKKTAERFYNNGVIRKWDDVLYRLP